jgi:hypothetical protein
MRVFTRHRPIWKRTHLPPHLPLVMPYREGNRFAFVTADDARAWPWVFGLLSLIFSTLVLAARVFARRKTWTWSDCCLGETYMLLSRETASTADIRCSVFICQIPHVSGSIDFQTDDEAGCCVGVLVAIV